MKKQACIFLNGEYNDQEPQVAQVRRDNLLIGVDGGTRFLTSLHLTPQLVIGDMDSLPTAELHRLKEAGVQIERHPREKDETDFELALDHAIRQGCKQVLVFGALGGRTDQLMGNILLPLAYIGQANILLMRGAERLMYITAHEIIHGNPGDMLSLLPLAGNACGVHTTGLRYPLDGETLIFGKSRGISNELTGLKATITISSGILLCIHTLSKYGSYLKEIK